LSERPAYRALSEISMRLGTASTGDAVGRALFSVAEAFGIESIIIVDMTHQFNPIGPALVFATVGRAPIETFDRERPFFQHPLTLHAQQTDKPFLISWLRKQCGATEDDWWKSLPPHLRNGNGDGVIVPVYDDGRLAWFTGFIGRSPDLSGRTLSILGAAAHAAYDRFCELLNAKHDTSPLTRRESDCLAWVAQGKTDQETGIILGISARTVRFHIENAKKKLGVATRIQAVTKRM
jgi:DNA-binding CsgD family transcriptional regulator